MSAEAVFVVPRSAIPGGTDWHGLRTEGVARTVVALEEIGQYKARHEMEQDPSFKQIIPYLVLRDGPRWFLMQRTDAGADSRLHGRYSLGVGGHLNPGDGGLLGGLRREWEEELLAAFVPSFHPIALLNDDTTEVGAVHLGVVYEADAAGRPVGIRETDKLTGRFVDSAAVALVADRLETWSRIIFDASLLGPVSPRAPTPL
jgi:predicted NUDIX family phosphoesterase